MPTKISRRHLLKNVAQTAAWCGLGATTGALPAAAAPATPRAGLRVGVVTNGFNKLTNAALARELSGAGIRRVQFFLTQSDSSYWKYNSRSDLSTLTPARCREIAALYRDAGLEIHSVGVYTNLIHPDERERQANLAYFEAMMEVGGHLGARTFVTESGHHRDPKAPAPAIPLEFQDTVWRQMIATVRQLAALAEKHDAKVLLEGSHRSFFTSAKRIRTFLEEVQSPRIRALLDPANLIEVNDLEEMFHQLAPWIDCIHAKDRKLHTDRGVAAGKGDLDYRQFVTLAARHTPGAPLFIEYVGPDDYRAALAHLRGALLAAGVAEL